MRFGIQAKQVSVRRCIATADVMLLQSTIVVWVWVLGWGGESGCKLGTDIVGFWEGDMIHVDVFQ